MHFHYAVAIWGEVYIEQFLGSALPTLMAPGNLPAFADRFPISLLLYTAPQFAERLERAPAMRRAAREIEVEVVACDKVDLGHPHLTMSAFLKLALKRARDDGAGIIMQNADSYWGDGSFAYVAELIAAGHEAILCMAFRAARQSFVPALLDASPPRDHAISVSPQDLIRLGLSHLHPYHGAAFWDGEWFNSSPTNFMWPVAGAGVVHRAMHMVPLVRVPSDHLVEFEGEIDSDYVQDAYGDLGDCHIITENDRLALVEGTALYDYLDKIEPASKPDSLEVAWFMRRLGGHLPFGGRMLATPFCHRFGNGDRAAWRRAKRDSRRVADELITSARALAASDLLDEAGAGLSARVLATALRVTEIASGPLARGLVTAFAPTGAEPDAPDRVILERLFAPGEEDALSEAILG
ncbi:MAG: hypothetical protein O7A68_07705, partial [Alphaproteobacteria bacterium]|nr:hypothetical protein [Alphaproteobacteria bacterium]